MKILHIHVKKEYWERAKQGIKKEEYREIKSYWIKKLEREYGYDLIYYYLGYTKKKRIFRFDGFVKKKIVHKEWDMKPKEVYAISLRKPIKFML